MLLSHFAEDYQLPQSVGLCYRVLLERWEDEIVIEWGWAYLSLVWTHIQAPDSMLCRLSVVYGCAHKPLTLLSID
ncbi:hypothetical protein GOBAR_DD14332 [Gossypium barbadense]|nr:hypothetical protein GOBAR_DD14332 [Gossypium barbadense]